MNTSNDKNNYNIKYDDNGDPAEIIINCDDNKYDGYVFYNQMCFFNAYYNKKFIKARNYKIMIGAVTGTLWDTPVNKTPSKSQLNICDVHCWLYNPKTDTVIDGFIDENGTKNIYIHAKQSDLPEHIKYIPSPKTTAWWRKICKRYDFRNMTQKDFLDNLAYHYKL